MPSFVCFWSGLPHRSMSHPLILEGCTFLLFWRFPRHQPPRTPIPPQPTTRNTISSMRSQICGWSLPTLLSRVSLTVILFFTVARGDYWPLNWISDYLVLGQKKQEYTSCEQICCTSRMDSGKALWKNGGKRGGHMSFYLEVSVTDLSEVMSRRSLGSRVILS